MVKIQTPKDKFWVDESGLEIPFNRISKAERLIEKNTAKIRKEAIAINAKMVEFKEMVKQLCAEAYEAFMEEKGVKPTKGNFTFYSFNRDIKVEVSINERIEFDDMTIKAAKAKFDDFLSSNIQSKNEFAKQMVMDAFSTQRKGNLDVKRVLQLTRYESKVNDALFSEAVTLIKEAIRKPDSKTYFRIWEKNKEGAYQLIDLNFSSI